MKTIGVVIVNYKQAKTVIPLVRNIAKEPEVKSIVVVDNSLDEKEKNSLKKLKLQKLKLVFPKKNLGFAAGCNVGVKNLSKVDYIALINPDVIYDRSNILKDLMEKIGTKQVDIVGPIIIDSKGKFIATAGYFPKWTQFWKLLFIMPKHLTKMIQKDLEVDWLSGAMLIMKNDTWKKLKGFDERFFLYFEDIDLFLRAKKMKLKTMLAGTIPVKHLAHQSVKQVKKFKVNKWYEESRRKYLTKWRGDLVYKLFAWLEKWRSDE